MYWIKSSILKTLPLFAAAAPARPPQTWRSAICISPKNKTPGLTPIKTIKSANPLCQAIPKNVNNRIPSNTYILKEKKVNELERLYQESGAQFGAIHTAGDEYHMKRGNNLLLELHLEKRLRPFNC
jgi:hypothetical protein